MNASKSIGKKIRSLNQSSDRAHPVKPFSTLLNLDTNAEIIFKTLEQLQTKPDQLLDDLTPEIIASITGYPFIREAVSALNAV